MPIEHVIEKYGILGAVAVGMFVLVRQLMVWMQGRIDAKDVLLAEQHDKALQVSQAVIDLAQDTATRTATALDALTDEIRGMSDGICQRLERIEGQK